MDLKLEIVVRSQEMFLKLGIRSVSMDDIATEIGVSKKTLYLHFPSKELLVQEVISQYIQHEKEQYGLILSNSKDALDELRQLGKLVMGIITAVSASTLFDLRKYYHASWEMLMEKQNEHDVACIILNLKRGMAEGLYRQDLEPQIVAKIFARSGFMVVDEIADRHSKFSRSQLIRELYHYHVNGIATPKGLSLWKKYAGTL